MPTRWSTASAWSNSRRSLAAESWEIDHASGVVTLHSCEEQDFCGKTLEEALAWCLVWLMVPKQGIRSRASALSAPAVRNHVTGPN